MAKLNITWTDLADTAVTTGSGGGTSEARDMSNASGMLRPGDAQEEKPILVYLTSSDPDDQVAQDVIDSTTLKDERVSLASKLFTMVKADGSQITEDHPYFRFLKGRELPRIHVFTHDGEEVGKLEGKASPSKLFSLMEKTARRTFKLRVDRFVKDYQEILTELDKLDTLKQAVAQKESRDISSREQRKLEEKKEEIAAEEEKLRAIEEKLLDFERRDAA